MIQNIENIELKFLTIQDYQELKDTMIAAYSNMPNSYWRESHIKALIEKFPEGQVVIKVNDQLAGCALSIIVDYDSFDAHHTYNGLSFFISSSSGMAVLTMPIMSPLADGVGIGREFIVNAYQYGMGLFYFINPTGLILASLAMAKIGFDKWLKFIMPLVLILLVFTMIFLTISVYI